MVLSAEHAKIAPQTSGGDMAEVAERLGKQGEASRTPSLTGLQIGFGARSASQSDSASPITDQFTGCEIRNADVADHGECADNAAAYEQGSEREAGSSEGSSLGTISGSSQDGAVEWNQASGKFEVAFDQFALIRDFAARAGASKDSKAAHPKVGESAGAAELRPCNSS